MRSQKDGRNIIFLCNGIILIISLIDEEKFIFYQLYLYMERHINHINSMKLTQNYEESFLQSSKTDANRLQTGVR